MPCRNVGADPLNVTVLISNTCRWLSRFMPEGRRSALLCLSPWIRTKSLLPVPIGLTLSPFSITSFHRSFGWWYSDRATKAIYIITPEGCSTGLYFSFPSWCVERLKFFQRKRWIMREKVDGQDVRNKYGYLHVLVAKKLYFFRPNTPILPDWIKSKTKGNHDEK